MKKRIGIVGGGQLGMMLTEAAIALGHTVTVLDKQSCPAFFAGADVLPGDITDPERIRELATTSDVTTIEIEHIEAEGLQALAEKGIVIHPAPQSLLMIKDKYSQKVFLRKNNILTADFLPIKSDLDFIKAGEKFGYPYVLKARHGAYDGRGNTRVNSKNDITRAKKDLKNLALYAEKLIPFTKELAIMVARSTGGEIRTYPVVETLHEKDILRYTYAPAQIPQEIAKRAEALAVLVMEHVHGAGVFGIEMFLTTESNVLVNEIAPRVHNSGHYTIEACKTSQFTQHIRAITGAKLGTTEMNAPFAVMVNILGERKGKANPKGTEKAEALGNTTVHWYHKHDTKPLRKMGHITVTGTSLDECREKAKKARQLVKI